MNSAEQHSTAVAGHSTVAAAAADPIETNRWSHDIDHRPPVDSSSAAAAAAGVHSTGPAGSSSAAAVRSIAAVVVVEDCADTHCRSSGKTGTEPDPRRLGIEQWVHVGQAPRTMWRQ